MVRQQMEDYLREELIKRNYSFVYTPHIARRELWQLSGHEQNYGDSMFAPTKLEETEFRLKPMIVRCTSAFTNRSSDRIATCRSVTRRWGRSIAPNYPG